MMTREARQEALSLAYVHAVAAACGMTYTVPSLDFGIDMTLNEIERQNRHICETGRQLDIQVKSTTSVVESRIAVRYDLPIRAYDNLRFQAYQPRILALLVLPENEADWLQVTRTRLELRKCMYWISLRGQPYVPNRSTVRVSIPKRQLFTPDSVREIMRRIRSGEEL